MCPVAGQSSGHKTAAGLWNGDCYYHRGDPLHFNLGVGGKRE